MEKQTITVLFICLYVILSAVSYSDFKDYMTNSVDPGHHLTAANKLYDVFNERKIRNMKHLTETELCRTCFEDIRNQRNFLLTLPKYRSLSKKSCSWCPYMFKVNPDSENDQQKVAKMQHWYDTGYQRKKREKRKIYSNRLP